MNRIERIFISSLASAFILTSTGCEDPDPYAPKTTHYFTAPRVTGIELIDEMGMSHGAWGSPSAWREFHYYDYHGGWGPLPSSYFIATYPNPSTGSFTLNFALPMGGNVTAWAVRALGPDETEEEIFNYSGSDLVVPPGAPAASVMAAQHFEAGEHLVEWDGTDDLGGRLPVGFYRLYLQADEVLMWNDILLLWNCSYVPYGIDVPMCH